MNIYHFEWRNVIPIPDSSSICLPQQMEFCRQPSQEFLEPCLPRIPVDTADTGPSSHIVPTLRPSSGQFFQCRYCTYKCRIIGNLKRHIKHIHTKERPFCCSICSYRCVTRYTLKRHLRKHTGEKPFRCFVCPVRFSDSSSLANHKLRYHHMENL